MKRNHKVTASRNTNGNLAMNSIVNKNDLPKNIQRQMKRNGNGSGKKIVRGASADVVMGNPTFYQPLFQATNMLLPRDRRERNEWCRHF